MKKIKNILKGTILLSAVTLLGACGNSNNSNVDKNVTEVTIPTFKAGQNVGAKLFLGQVDRFNEKHDGKYKINIEEIPQDAYGEQIKQLAQQNELPVIVHGPGSGTIDNQWFEKVIIENDMYYDLSDWLEENPEIEEVLIDEFIEFNTRENGDLVSVPDYKVNSQIMYYNETMYNPEKPIREMNLKEFSESLEDNKIAFMTGENAWTTGLFWTALIANKDEGTEFLQKQNVGELTDLSHPFIIESIKELKEFIEEHGASNTLGAIYADAANSFMSKNSALINNGPWMTAEFKEDEGDKWSNGFDGSDVRADYYPGNIGLQHFQSYGYWISADSSEEEIELAKEWFSFLNSPEEIEENLLAEGGQAPNYEPSSEFLEEISENMILEDIQEATTDETIFVPNILDLLPSTVGDNELSKYLPQLLSEEISAEEFAQKITEKAEEAVK